MGENRKLIVLRHGHLPANAETMRMKVFTEGERVFAAPLLQKY